MMTYPTDFKPNFFAKDTTILPHPISVVFSKLATGVGLKDVIFLSELASHCEVLQEDQVAVSGPLLETHVRHLPASSSVDDSSKRLLPRQAFTFTETISIIPHIYSVNVVLVGTLTRDEKAHVALYESASDGGIWVVKKRVFEEVDGGKATKVIESTAGMCPGWQRMIAQRTTTRVHRACAEAYHTLF
ncbi:hypothetical protein DL96DRAFT_1588431 [Flagelloscypha sp. PMI_526]|nr:hypothetical protein DL96DRAFT_1588431 [Flagelloscypha sp. PMI_526]